MATTFQDSKEAARVAVTALRSQGLQLNDAQALELERQIETGIVKVWAGQQVRNAVAHQVAEPMGTIRKTIELISRIAGRPSSMPEAHEE